MQAFIEIFFYRNQFLNECARKKKDDRFWDHGVIVFLVKFFFVRFERTYVLNKIDTIMILRFLTNINLFIIARYKRPALDLSCTIQLK